MHDSLFIQINHQYTALWRETNVLYEAWAKQYDLNYHELLVLLSLLETPDRCTQKKICEQWILPKQTVHCILQGLLNREWIFLQSSQNDRRSKEILFTPEGKRQAERICRALQKQELFVWSKLGADRASALLELTALYNQYFKEAQTHESP